jgi:hypothetical protein
MLGIHINVAVQWQHASSGDWMTYAADVSRRSRPGDTTPDQLIITPHGTDEGIND